MTTQRAQPAPLAVGDLVRVVNPNSYYVGMTGRVHFAGVQRVIIKLTARHNDARTFMPSELTPVVVERRQAA